MRVLRSTLYVGPPYRPGPDPLHVIVRDCDMQDTLESIAVRTSQGAADDAEKADLNSFVVHDIFTMRDADIEFATIQAGRRANEREENERNMATAYFWFVQDIAPMMQPDGIMGTKDPSPLSADDAEYVLDRVVQHPLVKRHRLTCVIIDRDGQGHTGRGKP